MKYLFVILSLILFTACTSYQIISISPNSSQKIATADQDDYSQIKLTNKSLHELQVSILNQKNNERTGGFGLNRKGTADVTISSSQLLEVTNSSNKKVKVKYVSKTAEAPKPVAEEYVSFTLRNNSAKSIPLIIPTVMNPNLSPMSNSGVDLKVGQEILFKVKGKTYVLLTVDSSYKDQKVDVAKVLKERKAELGL